jgi:hypothetical protein
MSIFRRMLRLGGYLNLAIAAAHLLVIAAMVPISRVLGHPAWAEGWTGRVRLALMAAGVAAFVGLLGLYGLSGGGRIRKLPFLRTGLLLTGAFFILLVASHGWRSLTRPSVAPLALCMGLLYLVGTIGLWRELQPTRRCEHKPGGGEA